MLDALPSVAEVLLSQERIACNAPWTVQRATGWLWKNPRSKFFASLDGYEYFIAKSSRSRYVQPKERGY
jgi:hypothetical protein